MVVFPLIWIILKLTFVSSHFLYSSKLPCFAQSIASPMLKNLLKQKRGKSHNHNFSITGVPYDATWVFIRFLYSSRWSLFTKNWKAFSLAWILKVSFMCLLSIKWVLVLFQWNTKLIKLHKTKLVLVLILILRFLHRWVCIGVN